MTFSRSRTNLKEDLNANHCELWVNKQIHDQYITIFNAVYIIFRLINA